ncbi:MAG TPA: bifunctional RNase H/acid phosphatase [Streptosporangiaceae bacterium]|nr:bifunctional RNase H/acid phosphatase [Streptosporangiaceae bacterium]
MTGKLVVEADGGSRGNPGPAGYGALVRDAGTGEVLAEVSDSLGTATNNVAEYSGLVAGLRAAAELAPGADLEVRMDSKLVVEQMSGRWQIKHPDLRPLAASARELAGRFRRVKYTWVPRARNAHADRLANLAMDAARGGGKGRTRRPTRSAESEERDPGPAGGDSRRAAPGWTQTAGPPTTTLLLRHGETEMSAARRFAGRTDVALTETGLRQAKAAGQRLAARGGIDLIVASPRQRARVTAEVVAAATGAPMQVEDAWQETDFGDWEGLTYDEVRQGWPEELAAWLGDTGTAPPGGESFAATTRRVLAALDRLLAAHPLATVLVVSHVTPMKVLLRHALLAPPPALRRMHLDVSALCEVSWYGEAGVVHSLNDTAHVP